MFSENNLITDSLKAVQDSIKNTQDSDLMNSLGFNISNVGSSEIILTVLGYGIVFLALLVLYIFLANLTKVLIASRKKKLKASGKTAHINDLTISGETAAAISTAILLHYQES